MLMAVMLLTSISVPEMTVNAAEPEDSITAEISVSDNTVVVETDEVTEETEDVTEVDTEESVSEEVSEEEEKTEDLVTEEVSEETKEENTNDLFSEETTEYIVGGDFTGLSWESGSADVGEWAFVNDSWTACSGIDVDPWADPDTSTGEEGYLGLALTYQEDGMATIQQTIASLPTGAYEMTAWVKGAWNSDASADYTTSASLYYGNTTSEEVVIPSSWTEVTYAFNVKSDATDAVVGINITSQSGAWICLDNVSLVRTGDCATTYTLEELSALYTTSAALVDGKAAEDFKAGYEELNTALTTAKALIDASSTDETAITEAYTELVTATANLQLADIEFTFYYYAGIGVDTVGLYYWDNANILSSTASKAEWKVWNAGDTYVMTEVEGYDGWFSIPLTFAGTILNNAGLAGVSVYSYDGSSATCLDGEFSNWSEDAKDKAAFTAFISKESNSYAVWNSLVFSGEEIEKVQRNVTLYVKDESGVPALMTKAALSYIDATSGEETSIAASSTDEWSNNYYHMKAVEDSENWYSLTFIVPSADDTGKICELYSYANESYAWVTNFCTSDGNYQDDVTQVFAGNTYYKNGTFYASVGDADGFTLGQLKALVASEEVTTAVSNGSEKYISGWEAFNTALTNANTLIASETYVNADDTTMDTTISSTYAELWAAWEDLEMKKPQVTIYYYSDEAAAEGNTLCLITWNSDYIKIDEEETCEFEATPGWTTTGYIAEDVDDEIYGGWKKIPVSLAEITQNNTADDGEGIVFHVLKDNITQDSFEISGYNNTSVFNAMVAAGDGGSIFVKDGVLYESIYDAETSVLTKLIKEADVILQNKDSYKEIGWAEFVAALTEAKDLLAADKSTHTREALAEKYDALYAAMGALVSSTEAEITVNQIALDNSFITGADLSSYVSLKDSGVVFKDKKGNALSDQEFFDMLYDGGTNWVRIRIWNDPYNGNGNGYGGGNNDLEKAVEIGKLATKAGMKVLIDFHYSDFWADPAKQDPPKAWKGFSLEQKQNAVAEFTLESLNTLHANGVNVRMVQVGNETNNSICGEASASGMAAIFNAGSSAVREFEKIVYGAETEAGSEVSVAVHFTDPQDGFATVAADLAANNVDYDVFASSYYPFWHGTTSQLYSALEHVASSYGKKVMVAETSWTTTWEDGDGHGNTAPKTSGQDLQYAVSVQGQADEMRAVVNTVNNINEKYAGQGIGVFYWEPAWLSKYYAYNADGTVNQAEYKKNQELWEKYGSGWASSYSSEYDPTDAGLWYGGSAIDNQAWFDFDGTALPTAEAYALMRTGATAALKLSQVETQLTADVNLGADVPWDELSTVTASFNNGSTEEYTVVWDKDDKSLVNTDQLGEYTVSGIVTCVYDSTSNDVVTTITEKYDVTLTIKVLSTANVLENEGFEKFVDKDTMEAWVITYCEDCPDEGDYAYDVFPKTSAEDGNPRTGSYGLNFYRLDNMHFTVEQTVTNLAPGSYTYGGYIQGGSAGPEDIQYAYVNVYNSADELTASYKAEAALSGWLNWANPEIKGIKVAEGDYVKVGMEITTTKDGAWGSIDDMYLYGSYDVDVVDSENGSITVSNLEAVSGEVVRIAATPDKGYTLVNLSISGNAVDDEILTGMETDTVASSYDAETKTATLAYENNANAVTYATFKMPYDKVHVSATFESIFEKETKISLENENIVVSEIDDQWYTGKAIKPSFTVSYLGYTMKSGTDYTVTYSANKEPGTATITLTGKGKFEKTKEVTFTIKEDDREALKNYKIIFNDYDDEKAKSYYYTADYVTPDITVQKVSTVSGNKITREVDPENYNVYYQNNMKVSGSANVIVVAKNGNEDYKGSITQNFKIAKCPVSELTISKPSGSTYTGKAITPNVTVKLGNIVLQKGKDYTVSYRNNTKVSGTDAYGNSTTYMVVNGKGNFTGKSENLYFKVIAKSLTDSEVKATVADLAYNNGSKLTPKVVVKDGTKTLTNNRDYTYTIIRTHDADGTPVEEAVCKDNKVTEKGTYKVVITAKEGSNYRNEIDDVTFQVKDKSLLLSRASITTVKQIFTGDRITLTESAVKGQGDIVVIIDKKIVDPGDYKVEYLDSTNIKAGTAKIRIVAEEGSEYFGSKDATFKIEKRKVDILEDGETPDAKKGYISIKLVEDDIYGTTQYYTGYNLTPELEVTSVNNGVAKILTKGIDYTVRYSKNQKAGDIAQITISAKGNYSGSVTFKNAEDTFVVQDRCLNDFIVTIDPVAYTGRAIKPVVKFVDKETGVVTDLKSGTAYTISYKNNTNAAGKNDEKYPYVIIKENGLNKEASGKEKVSATIKFTISPAKINATDVKDVLAQNYSNKPVQPSWTVKVNGRALRLNKDYIVTYENNNRLGEATATITGIGNYSGEVVKTFVIK